MNINSISTTRAILGIIGLAGLMLSGIHLVNGYPSYYKLVLHSIFVVLSIEVLLISINFSHILLKRPIRIGMQLYLGFYILLIYVSYFVGVYAYPSIGIAILVVMSISFIGAQRLDSNLVEVRLLLKSFDRYIKIVFLCICITPVLLFVAIYFAGHDAPLSEEGVMIKNILTKPGAIKVAEIIKDDDWGICILAHLNMPLSSHDRFSMKSKIDAMKIPYPDFSGDGYWTLIIFDQSGTGRYFKFLRGIVDLQRGDDLCYVRNDTLRIISGEKYQMRTTFVNFIMEK